MLKLSERSRKLLINHDPVVMVDSKTHLELNFHCFSLHYSIYCQMYLKSQLSCYWCKFCCFNITHAYVCNMKSSFSVAYVNRVLKLKVERFCFFCLKNSVDWLAMHCIVVIFMKKVLYCYTCT